VVLLQRRLLFECLDTASPQKRLCKDKLEKIETMAPKPITPVLSSTRSRAESSLAAEVAAAQELSNMVKEADLAMKAADESVQQRWAFLRAFTLTAACERVLPLLVEDIDVRSVFE
jgi:hypothetical protein